MNKDKLNLFMAIVINNIGDIIFDLAIIWNITVLTGNIMDASILLSSSITFRAIISIFSGIIVDKFNKKLLVKFSLILSAIIISIMMLFWNLFPQHIYLYGLICILLNNISNELFRKSYLLICCEKFDDSNFLKLQSIITISIRIIGILGSISAGVLIYYFDLNVIFIFNIITFILSFIFFTFVKYEELKKEKISKNLSFKSVLNDMFVDIKFLFTHLTNSKYILSFLLLMLILNLVYAYIPQMLPLYLANKNNDVSYLSMITSALIVGEVIGLALVVKLNQYVSLNFKISMFGSFLAIISLLFVFDIKIAVLAIFLLYGCLDSLTQPLFNFTIKHIDPSIRGRIIGGIDCLILLTPGLGLLIIGYIMKINESTGIFVISIIFLIGFLFVNFNKNLNNIKLDKERVN